jgi:ATP-binding cassette, subfamily B, bacterial
MAVSTFHSDRAAEFTVSNAYRADRRGPIRWIFSHAKRHYFLISLALLGAVGNAILAANGSILIGQAFDVFKGNSPDLHRLGQIALQLGFLLFIKNLFLQLTRNFGFELMCQKIERDVRDELYSSLLGKSMTFHSRQPVGDIMARATNDVREVNFLFNPGLNMVIGSLTFLFTPLFYVSQYHPSLILAPALFVVFYFLALWYHLSTLRPVTEEVRAAFGQLNTRLSESIDGIETVKGASQEKQEVIRFGRNARRYRDAIVKQGKIEARFFPLLLFNIATAAALFHALMLFRQGLLSVGNVVGYFGIIMMLDFPTFTSMWAYSQISLGLAGARRILDLLNREDNLDQNPAGYREKMRGEIEFRHVDFSYEGNDSTLRDVNFTVKPGQTVAIVGQTGSGKTSLTRLVNRTYDVSSGQVLVDGVDVREWSLEGLRKNISIIEQDVFLFSRSISENIAFGKQDATAAEILSAARQAQADEFIQATAEGYKTVIGERGVTLSGGQRQRLALARAFLTDPAILILDDSTSAIDSATEDLIQRAIFAAARGRTTLIITHRLSQIRWADIIIVLRKGRIAAIGSHEELLKTSEAYRNIFRE